MNPILSLFLFTSIFLQPALPGASQTSWMRPESFRVRVGMSRADVLERIESGGWKAKPGKNASQLVVDYTDERSLTLEFHRDRLHAVQFELFGLIPPIKQAFTEEKSYLADTLGAPRKASPSVVLYDAMLPNV